MISSSGFTPVRDGHTSKVYTFITIEEGMVRIYYTVSEEIVHSFNRSHPIALLLPKPGHSNPIHLLIIKVLNLLF